MDFKYKGKNYIVNRFPKSTNKSLRPWSASDEYALSYAHEHDLIQGNILLYNDRFGFFANVLSPNKPVSVIDYKSQERAITRNLTLNTIAYSFDHFIAPLSAVEKPADLVIFKIPKSLELFELHLQHMAQYTTTGTVICHFMTRNFSKQMIEIAAHYFENIKQSKAVKKARLLILTSPKKVKAKECIHTISLEKDSFKQYYGVFSSDHIDYASQFLMENIHIATAPKMVLDLASGNGVLAHYMRKIHADAEIHLVDDMKLAVESSKLNLTDQNTYFHWNNSLEEFESGFFDAIVCNPPFHFEHETNIEVSLDLFKQAKRCLKKGGAFWIVANKHLNYKTHLSKLFKVVNTEKENDKFVIYTCAE